MYTAVLSLDMVIAALHHEYLLSLIANILASCRVVYLESDEPKLRVSGLVAL